MKVRPWAEFNSTLPDDHIDDGEQIIQFGGKSVAAAVGEILRSLGCDAEPPKYAGDHGWEFDIKAEERRFWCQVTLIEGYLMVLDNPSWWDRVLGRRPRVYLDLLQRLAQELARDPRFSEVRWFAPDEVMTGAPGSPTPVG